MIVSLINRFNQHKLFNRVILIYLLTSLLTTLIIGFVFYYFLSEDVIDQIGRNSLNNLNQTAYTVNTLDDQIITLSSQIFTERNIQNFIYSRQENKVLTFRAGLYITRIKSAYPFINSIELYNANAETYYNSLRPIAREFSDLKNQASSFFDELAFQSSRTKLREITITKVNISNNHLLYSYVFKPVSLINDNAIIIINLDLKYLHDETLRFFSSDLGDQTIIVNKSGNVVMHGDMSHFLADYSKHEYIERLDADDESGYSIHTIDRINYLITYTTSDNPDWIYINIKPYDSIVGELRSSRNLVLLLSLGFFIFTLIFYLAITRKIFNPFRKLIDRLGGTTSVRNDLDLLEHAISNNIRLQYNHEKHCHDKITIELLTGQLDPEISDQDREEFHQQYEARRYCVLLYSFDHSEVKENKELNLLYCLSNIADEILSSQFVCYAVPIENNDLAILCGGDHFEQLSLKCQQIQKLYRDFFKQTFSISVSNAVDSLTELSRQYSYARSLLIYRFFTGHNSNINETVAQQYINNDATYPVKIEEGLLDAIRSNNQQGIDEVLYQFQEELYLTAPDHLHNFVAQLAYAILAKADSLGVIKQLPYDRISKIWSIDTIDEMVHLLSQLACEISISAFENQYVSKDHKHIRTIDNLKSKIENDYGNPNLSIEIIHNEYQLSAEYLRKLFKQIEGVSFSNYLTSIRLNKARQLLLNTNLPANKIGEQVGILNSSYFFTLFKKVYGCTPITYRDEYNRQSGSSNRSRSDK